MALGTLPPLNRKTPGASLPGGLETTSMDSLMVSENYGLDESAIHEYLQRFYVNDTDYVSVTAIRRTGGLLTETVRLNVAQWREMLLMPQIRRWHDDPDVTGIYARNTTLKERPVSGRGTSSSNAHWVQLSADLDYGKGGNYAPDAETLIKVLAESDLPQPTNFVHSGHGVYPQWVFDVPQPHSAEMTNLSKDLGDFIIEHFESHGYALDSTVSSDAARIFRIPGTVNRKAEPVPARFIDGGSGETVSYQRMRDIVPVSERASYSADANILADSELVGSFKQGEPCAAVRTLRETCENDIASHGYLEHGNVLKKVTAACLMGREGHTGVPELLDWLRNERGSHLDTRDGNRQHLDRPGGEWESALIEAQSREIDPENMCRCGVSGHTPLTALSASVPTEEETADFLLPTEIWSRTPVMEHIYQAALSEMVSPDALLHAVLAKVAAYQHHDSRLHTGKGSSGFNYFFAPVAASGGGKTVAMHTADALLDEWCKGKAVTLPGQPKNSPLGSGEGIQEAFMSMVPAQELADDGTPLIDDDGKLIFSKQKVKKQVTHNVLFSTDEGRTALKIEERAGATLFPTLCSMWSSSSLGAANAKEETSRSLDPYSYSVGLILGFQVDTINALFDDNAGGAPQRFAFAPTEYAPYETMTELDEQDIEWPGPLKPLSLNFPVDVHLNDSAKMEVRKHRRLTASGKHRELGLNGHAMLLRCRMAGLIALLHGERVVSDEVWRLSKVMLDASCAYRDWLSEVGKRREMESNATKSARTVATAVESSSKSRQQALIEEVADLLIERLPDEGKTEGQAINALPKSKRGEIAKAAIQHGIATGRLERVTVSLDNSRGGPASAKLLRPVTTDEE